MNKRINFAAVNAVALRALPLILSRWLPDGKRLGREFVARNPTRADRSTGSFSINLVTGKWSDFAANDSGGNPVSLAAYLFGLSQVDAARRLADMLGIDADRGEGGPLPRGRETWSAYHSVEDRGHSCIDGAGYVSTRSGPNIGCLPSGDSVFGLIAKRTKPWTRGEGLPHLRRVY
jgi:hypothetical protein